MHEQIIGDMRAYVAYKIIKSNKKRLPSHQCTSCEWLIPIVAIRCAHLFLAHFAQNIPTSDLQKRISCFNFFLLQIKNLLWCYFLSELPVTESKSVKHSCFENALKFDLDATMVDFFVGRLFWSVIKIALVISRQKDHCN